MGSLHGGWPGRGWPRSWGFDARKRFVTKFTKRHRRLAVGLITVAMMALAVCGIYGVAEVVKNLILVGEVTETTDKVMGRLAGEGIEEGIEKV